MTNQPSYQTLATRYTASLTKRGELAAELQRVKRELHDEKRRHLHSLKYATRCMEQVAGAGLMREVATLAETRKQNARLRQRVAKLTHWLDESGRPDLDD